MSTDWLLDEIETGIQKLLCLSLDRTPAAEIIAGTSRAWLEALTYRRSWDQQRDTERVRIAFAVLAQNCRKWPVPQELWEAMPAANLQPRLERPSNIPASRERRMAKMAEIFATLEVPGTASGDKALIKQIEAELRPDLSTVDGDSA